MKTVLLVLTLLAQFTFAQDIGSQLELIKVGDNYDFSIVFAHDMDHGLLVTAGTSGPTLADGGPLYSLAYRFYDTTTKTFLTDWVLYHQKSTPTYLPGTYVIQISEADKDLVVKLGKSLKSLRLVVLINQEKTPITKHIAIDELCKIQPENFVDITTDKTGCNTF